MRKKYLLFVVVLSLIVFKVNAISFLDCDVVASFRLLSLEEDNYICKNKNYGKAEDAIYYDSVNNNIVLKGSNIYYFTNYDVNTNIVVSGENNITMMHLDTPINISGTGSIKFKEDSFVKKVNNGEKVYQYEYNGKLVINEEKKIFEGTLLEFADVYSNLIELNNLPEEFREEDYNLIQVTDFINMVPVLVTPSWIANYIVTSNSTDVVDGYAVIKGEEKQEEKKEEVIEDKKSNDKKEVKKVEQSTTLTNQNVTLVSEKKLNKKYKLKVNDLTEKEEEIKEEVSDGKVVSLYDISIYKGKKQVPVKNGKYVIKIKLSEEDKNYDSYQVIYVSKDGKITEYLDGKEENGYIVFETTHLSKYGIVGKKEEVKKVKETKVVPKVKIEKKKSNILQIGIMLFCTLVFLTIILFVVYQSKHIKKR